MQLAEHIIKSEINSKASQANDAKKERERGRQRVEPIIKFELNKDCVCLNLFATRNSSIYLSVCLLS